LAMAIYLVSVRDSSNVHVQDNQEVSMTPTTAITGIVDKPSNHSVDETVALENLEMSEREPFILLS